MDSNSSSSNCNSSTGMEIQSVKFETCLEVIPESELQPETKKIPSYPYLETDIQHLSILELEQWRNIGFVNVPPIPLIQAPKSINSNVTNKVSIKRPREESIEYAAKSNYELRSLYNMTTMVLKSENQLIQPYYRPIKDTNTTTTPSMTKLTSNHRIYHKQNLFQTVVLDIMSGMNRSYEVLSARKLWLEKLSVLGKYWRLSTLTSDVYRTNGISSPSSSSSSFREDVSVDCSYVTLGDSPSTIYEYLVPIDKVDGKFMVKESELSRSIFTLSLRLHHHSIGTLSEMNAWEILHSMTRLDYPWDSNDMNELAKYELLDIHHHCIKKKHGAFCSRLFGRLRQQAIESQDQWLLKPILSHDNLSSQSMDSKLSILTEEVFYNNPQIWLIERGEIIIGLSDHLSISFRLVSLLVENTSHHSHSHSDMIMKERNVLDNCLMDAFLTSRTLLFYQFQTNLETKKSPVEELVSSLSSSSSSSSSSLLVPLDRKVYLTRKIDTSQSSSVTSTKHQSIQTKGSILHSFIGIVKSRIWKILFEQSNCFQRIEMVCNIEPIYSSHRKDIVKKLFHHDITMYPYLCDEFISTINLSQSNKTNQVLIILSSAGIRCSIRMIESKQRVHETINGHFTRNNIQNKEDDHINHSNTKVFCSYKDLLIYFQNISK